MENLVFTQLSISEVKKLFRQELQDFFEQQKNNEAGPKVDEFLTIEEAGEFIKLSVPSMYRLCKERKLPNHKKGGKILFSKKELMGWVMEGRRKTAVEISTAAGDYLGKQGLKKNR